MIKHYTVLLVIPEILLGGLYWLGLIIGGVITSLNPLEITRLDK